MNVGPLVLFAAGGLGLAIVTARWSSVWLALVTGAGAALISAALQVLTGGSEWEWRGTFLIGGETPHLRLDAISGLFLLLVGVIGTLGAAYARGYWADADHPRSATPARRWWSALLLSLAAVLMASNGLHFLLGWELFAVSSYFLITLERRPLAVRRAGWLFLAASHTGTLCLFAFFTALAAQTGTWDLGPLRDRTALAPLFWLALVGFGVKAGMFPLHVWLPSAHANAPSHVSAVLSGVAIKMGIYGLVRFSGWLPAPAAAGWVVLGLGAVSALLGIAFALAQDDLKRLLAYSSVENIGVMLVGVGGALLGAAQGDAPWGRLALAGALLHVWNHALFKALLFFGAGAVLHATGTREMSRLGGLWRAMPWTAGVFALGAMAVSALPPLNGFVSEWLVYLGLLDAANTRGPAAWAAMPAAIMLAMTGALALATFVKAGAIVFLGAPRTKAAVHAHEAGAWMRAPMLALAGACLLAGLAPVWFWPAIARAVGTWHPTWSETMPPALGTLAGVHAVLAFGLGAAAFALWRRAGANGARRAPTWDCGFAAPSPRMQYTSGAFAGIAARWFSPLLRFDRVWRRPRGPLPARALHLENLPDAVLARVLTPLARGVLHGSSLVRQLQHGRVQFYIVYVVLGLAGLSALVWLEGSG